MFIDARRLPPGLDRLAAHLWLGVGRVFIDARRLVSHTQGSTVFIDSVCLCYALCFDGFYRLRMSERSIAQPGIDVNPQGICSPEIAGKQLGVVG